VRGRLWGAVKFGRAAVNGGSSAAWSKSSSASMRYTVCGSERKTPGSRGSFNYYYYYYYYECTQIGVFTVRMSVGATNTTVCGGGRLRTEHQWSGPGRRRS